MRKYVMALLLALLIAAQAGVVVAGGDKVRGDKAAGPATQQQVNFSGYERRP